MAIAVTTMTISTWPSVPAGARKYQNAAAAEDDPVEHELEAHHEHDDRLLGQCPEQPDGDQRRGDDEEGLQVHRPTPPRSAVVATRRVEVVAEPVVAASAGGQHDRADDRGEQGDPQASSSSASDRS